MSEREVREGIDAEDGFYVFLKYFWIATKDSEKAEEFIDELEVLCKKYATKYYFSFK